MDRQKVYGWVETKSGKMKRVLLEPENVQVEQPPVVATNTNGHGAAHDKAGVLPASVEKPQEASLPAQGQSVAEAAGAVIEEALERAVNPIVPIHGKAEGAPKKLVPVPGGPGTPEGAAPAPVDPTTLTKKQLKALDALPGNWVLIEAESIQTSKVVRIHWRDQLSRHGVTDMIAGALPTARALENNHLKLIYDELIAFREGERAKQEGGQA